MSTEVAVRNGTVGARGLQVSSYQDLVAVAEMALAGGLAKKDLNKMQVAAIIAHGLEVGFGPAQALSCISFINGKAAVYGDGVTGLLHQSGLLEDMKEWVDGEGDARAGHCILRRRGIPTPYEARFSVGDAKKAGLWGKQGPWSAYPDRMLIWRARGWASRDGFSDVLRGLWSAEEAGDLPKPPAETPTHVVRESRPLLKKPPATAEEAKARVVEILAEAPVSEPEPATEKTMEELSRGVDADEEKRKQIAAMVFFRGFGLSDERIFAKLGIGGIEDLDEPRRDVLKLIAKEAAKLTKEKADWRGYLNQEFPEPAF